MPISTREVKIARASGRWDGRRRFPGARGGRLPARGRLREGACPGVRGSGGPAGLVAQPEAALRGRILDDDLDGPERLAQGPGRVIEQAPALGAGHADPLVAAPEVDLAVVEAVVIV